MRSLAIELVYVLAAPRSSCVRSLCTACKPARRNIHRPPLGVAKHIEERARKKHKSVVVRRKFAKTIAARRFGYKTKAWTREQCLQSGGCSARSMLPWPLA